MRQTALGMAYTHLTNAEAMVQSGFKNGGLEEAEQDTIRLRVSMSHAWSQLARACVGADIA